MKCLLNVTSVEKWFIRVFSVVYIYVRLFAVPHRPDIRLQHFMTQTQQLSTSQHTLWSAQKGDPKLTSGILLPSTFFLSTALSSAPALALRSNALVLPAAPCCTPFPISMCSTGAQNCVSIWLFCIHSILTCLPAQLYIYEHIRDWRSKGAVLFIQSYWWLDTVFLVCSSDVWSSFFVQKSRASFPTQACSFWSKCRNSTIERNLLVPKDHMADDWKANILCAGNSMGKIPKEETEKETEASGIWLGELKLGNLMQYLIKVI